MIRFLGLTISFYCNSMQSHRTKVKQRWEWNFHLYAVIPMTSVESKRVHHGCMQVVFHTLLLFYLGSMTLGRISLSGKFLVHDTDITIEMIIGLIIFV